MNDSKLEFDYLSSSEKLLEYQKLYFENLLIKKSLKELKTLEIIDKELVITKLKISGKLMKNKERFILYDNNNEFEYTKTKSDINIKFNRVAFIFFYFFYYFNYIFNSFSSSWLKKF